MIVWRGGFATGTSGICNFGPFPENTVVDSLWALYVGMSGTPGSEIFLRAGFSARRLVSSASQIAAFDDSISPIGEYGTLAGSGIRLGLQEAERVIPVQGIITRARPFFSVCVVGSPNADVSALSLAVRLRAALATEHVFHGPGSGIPTGRKYD